MKVVVSLDGSTESRAVTRWCAEHLAPGTKVIGVCGVGQFGEFVISLPPFEGPTAVSEIVDALGHNWSEPLRRAGLDFEPHLVHRQQVPALLEVLGHERPDVLVLANPRGPDAGHHHSLRTLKRLLEGVRCPILLVENDVAGADASPAASTDWRAG